MYASRTATRVAARAARSRASTKQIRFATTNQQAAAAGGTSGLVAGIAGGAVVFTAGYSYYHFSGAKTIVNAASSTKKQLSSLTKNLQNSAPEPNEAIKWLRQTATSYAAFIPGAKSYVDSAFNDLEAVQQKHGKEVDQIVNDAYKQLKAASASGFSAETATKSYAIFESTMKKLGELASDSASDILDNHPQLREKVGGNLDSLKKMASNYGPDAKKELDETYDQIKDVVKAGISGDSIAKIKKLIEEKTEKIQKLGNTAWEKGLEQAKPYLEKNPKVKEIVEQNADALKQGNFSELFEKVKDAVSSGDTSKLQEYAQQAGEKAKGSKVGQSIMQYAKMIPGGEEIFPKLQKLQEVATKRGDEAEGILKKTYEEIKEVLHKRIQETEKLAEGAKEDAKK